MKVLTPAQMRAAEDGLPGILLMEDAAYGLLRELEKRFSPLGSQRIAIVCGKGNNGGDGLALARLLFVHHHVRPTIILAHEVEEMTASAVEQIRLIEAFGLAYTMQLPLDLPATTLAIDALLGTGATGEVREPIASLVAAMNALPVAKRIAVDIPSGALQADLTVTFAAPKLSWILKPIGELVVVPISIPASKLQSQLNLTTATDIQAVAIPRQPDAYKNKFGHIAVLGGGGALNLAGESAIRSGAGLVTLYSPDPGFRAALPDLMQGPWPGKLEGKAVVAIGPGLGHEHREFVADLYTNLAAPLVLDADALSLLSGPPTVKFPRVLTPHPGEMKRLLGRDITDRVSDAQSLAKLTACIVVLKGHRTLVAFPDGEVCFNSTGSPALAKAGSGDVLTGMIAAFLGQFETKLAVLAAVYLHGRCGELAATHGHEMTSLASRLCDYLPEALHELPHGL